MGSFQFPLPTRILKIYPTQDLTPIVGDNAGMIAMGGIPQAPINVPAPTLPDYTQAANVPLAPPLPSEQHYRQLLAQMPHPEQPRLSQRILNAIQAGIVGLQQGGAEGIKTAQQLTYAPYQRQFEDWRNKVAAFAPQYQMEQGQYQRGLEGYKLQADQATRAFKELDTLHKATLADVASAQKDKDLEIKGRGVAAREQANQINADYRKAQIQQMQDEAVRKKALDKFKTDPRETAAAMVAQEAGFKFDPSKNIFDQLPFQLREEALKREHDYDKNAELRALQTEKAALAIQQAAVNLDKTKFEMSLKKNKEEESESNADHYADVILSRPDMFWDLMRGGVLDKDTKRKLANKLAMEDFDPDKLLQGPQQRRDVVVGVTLHGVQKVRKLMQNPQVRNNLGVLRGRIMEAKFRIGDLSKEEADFVSTMTYLRMNEGSLFTATGGAGVYVLKELKNAVADPHLTPEALDGALKATYDHATSLRQQMRGRPQEEESSYDASGTKLLKRERVKKE